MFFQAKTGLTRTQGERIGKISLTSPTVINVPTRALLAVETNDLLFVWLAHAWFLMKKWQRYWLVSIHTNTFLKKIKENPTLLKTTSNK